MPRPCWWYTCEFCSGRIYGPRVYTHENCESYVILRTHRLTPLASRLTFEEARQNLGENNAAVESAARQKEHAVLEEAAKKGAGSRCLEIERDETKENDTEETTKRKEPEHTNLEAAGSIEPQRKRRKNGCQAVWRGPGFFGFDIPADCS